MEGSPPCRRRRLTNPPQNSQESVEQKRVKNSPCCFCQLNLDVTNFENHILDSEICRNLYKKLFGVTTVDGILVKTFDCLFCPARFFKLFDHLGNSAECRLKYFERLGVDNLK